MSWLSKTVKSVAPVVAPIETIGTGGLIKAGGGSSNPLDKLLGIGAKTGPVNPYGKPDLSYLADTSGLDYLRNPDTYKSLLDTSKYDFLKQPSQANQLATSLPGDLKTFASTYQAPGYSKSNGLYSDLINATNGPSSVDQVRQELNSDQLNQLLSGIDTDTKGTLGNLKSDFADRGLGGPGMLSDIEANAEAQAYGDAAKTKAAARTTLGQSTLDLLKNRENQNIAARTAAAGAGQAEDTQANQISAAGAQTDVNNYLDALKTRAAAGESAAARTNTNQLSYADLLKSSGEDYASNTSTANNLFAQLLNARDLGAAGINSTNYNTGTEDQYKYAQPGFLDSILRNVQLKLGA